MGRTTAIPPLKWSGSRSGVQCSVLKEQTAHDWLYAHAAWGATSTMFLLSGGEWSHVGEGRVKFD